MAKEKAIGVVLLVVGAFLAVLYLGLFIAEILALAWNKAVTIPIINVTLQPDLLWLLLLIPAALVMLVIGVGLLWVGYALLVTPPVEEIKIEEIEKELEKEAAKTAETEAK